MPFPFPIVKMINYTGIASIVLFYILILAVGMWAARKNTGGADQEVRKTFCDENESNLGQERKVSDWTRSTES